jgi:hypothetical protein
MMAMGIALLPGQTQVQTQSLYATLQKPGAPSGYVTSSLSLGLESVAGFFVVSGETLRVGNADYKIIENAQVSKDGKTYSLQDAKGRFLICNKDVVSVSATPSGDAQWFQIRRYTAAQKTEFENTVRANEKVRAQPGFEAHTD